MAEAGGAPWPASGKVSSNRGQIVPTIKCTTKGNLVCNSITGVGFG